MSRLDAVSKISPWYRTNAVPCLQVSIIMFLPVTKGLNVTLQPGPQQLGLAGPIHPPVATPQSPSPPDLVTVPP